MRETEKEIIDISESTEDKIEFSMESYNKKRNIRAVVDTENKNTAILIGSTIPMPKGYVRETKEGKAGNGSVCKFYSLLEEKDLLEDGKLKETIWIKGIQAVSFVSSIMRGTNNSEGVKKLQGPGGLLYADFIKGLE